MIQGFPVPVCRNIARVSLPVFYGGFLGGAIVLFGLLSACSNRPIETRYIVSDSMAPALVAGDRLIVERYVDASESPERGEIVLFQSTPKMKEILGPTQSPDSPFVFRVIGLPGETVAVKQGRVLINNRPLKEPYIQTPSDYEVPPTKVPDGEFWVLGDNRNNAFDGHYWGFVPRENLIGEVTGRYFPLDRAGAIPQVTYDP